jgi:hypothetical protein
MKRRKPITIEHLRERYPLGATVYYRGNAIGTVCGYNRWINGSYDNEPEILYVNWKVARQYPSKIGQFSARASYYRTIPFYLAVHDHHPSGIGSTNYRKIIVYFNPKDCFVFERVWFDKTNNEWAIWSNDLYKVVR